MTMLGEMPLQSGNVDKRGEIVYVPQEAWIFSGTIQENILFGTGFKKEKYLETLKMCALDKVRSILIISI